MEKCIEFNTTIHQLFVDFKQAFDSINRFKVLECMAEFGIPDKLIRLVKMTLSDTLCKVKIQNKTSNAFQVRFGVRQGDSLSSILFNLALEKVIRSIKTNPGGTIMNRLSQHLAYADDVNLIARNKSTLKELFTALEMAANDFGLKINEDKTKYMTTNLDDTSESKFEIHNYKFELVKEFKYLGSIISNKGGSQTDIRARLLAANRCYFALLDILKSRQITRMLKLKIYKTIIRPIAIFGSECWTLNLSDERLLVTWERKILRKILGAINDNGIWRIRKNKEIYDLFREPDIIVIIKRGRLRWLGHLLRMDEDKTVQKIFRGNPGGKRKRGRPKKRWIDEVSDDLRTLGIVNWKEKALDRVYWTAIVEEAKILHGL